MSDTWTARGDAGPPRTSTDASAAGWKEERKQSKSDGERYFQWAWNSRMAMTREEDMVDLLTRNLVMLLWQGAELQTPGLQGGVERQDRQLPHIVPHVCDGSRKQQTDSEQNKTSGKWVVLCKISLTKCWHLPKEQNQAFFLICLIFFFVILLKQETEEASWTTQLVNSLITSPSSAEHQTS